jgi:hypothetical protein
MKKNCQSSKNNSALVAMLGIAILIFSTSCHFDGKPNQTSCTPSFTPKRSSTSTPEPPTPEPPTPDLTLTEEYKETEDYLIEVASADMATLETRRHTPIVGISNYYGKWTITEHYSIESDQTISSNDNYPDSFLGESIYISGDDFHISRKNLFSLPESCNNPSYRWIPASETTGTSSQALLYGHPDTRLGLLYMFDVYCNNEAEGSFQVSASDRLVFHWSPYWFFLERTGDAPDMTALDATAVPPTPIPFTTHDLSPPGIIYTLHDGLYVTRENGNSQFLVSDKRGYFSPDYQYLLYEDFGEYYVLDLKSGVRILELDLWDQENESEGKRLTGATWSFDNQYIYYCESYPGEWLSDIWSINLQTGEKTNLSKTPDRIEYGPILMNDQQHLVFRSDHIDNIGQFSTGLFTSMKVDGSNYNVYTQLEDTYMFKISPDRSKAAIFGGEVFTIENGFQQTPLKIIGEIVPENFELIHPSWSPDSNYIGWSVYSNEEFTQVNGIGIQDVNSNTIRFFIPYRQYFSEYPRAPEFSPDNKWMSITKLGNATSKWRLTFVSIDDSEEHDLGEFFNPVWNFDSQRIILNSGYDEYGADQGAWITNVNNWKVEKLDLPDDAYVKLWLDPDFISDWFEVSN